MKKKAIVIGSKVSESLSPLIFNYWFKMHNVDATYSFLEIQPKNFDQAITSLLNDDELCGFNVTIPFKELIKNKIDNLDNHSQEIGAINCVSKINQKWIGKNTDWLGFYNSIIKIKNKHNIKRALVLGYGGASKAVIYALKKAGLNNICVYNRTSDKIKENVVVTAINYNEIYKEASLSELIINTTPVNILFDIFDKKIPKGVFAYDIVYKPKETDFLSGFDNAKKIYGISMLVHQAAPCFEEWFGIKPIITEELYALLNKKIT